MGIDYYNGVYTINDSDLTFKSSELSILRDKLEYLPKSTIKTLLDKLSSSSMYYWYSTTNPDNELWELISTMDDKNYKTVLKFLKVKYDI
jgi:hypothetical protein